MSDDLTPPPGTIKFDGYPPTVIIGEDARWTLPPADQIAKMRRKALRELIHAYIEHAGRSPRRPTVCWVYPSDRRERRCCSRAASPVRACESDHSIVKATAAYSPWVEMLSEPPGHVSPRIYRRQIHERTHQDT